MIKRLLFLLLLFPLVASASTIVVNPKFGVLDDNGDPLSGGLLYSYECGTTTPKATCADITCSSNNANPLVLDARGEGDVFGETCYKLDVKTSAGVQVTGFPRDNVYGIGGAYNLVSLNDTYTCDLGAAITAIGATKTTLVVDCTSTLADGDTDTIPTTLTLSYARNGLIQGTAGGLTETLVLNSTPVIPAGHQAFGSDLTVTGNGIVEAYPEYWGAVADGATDDYTAINATITYIKQTDNTTYLSSSVLKLSPNKIYKTGTTLFLGNSTSNTGVRRVAGNKSTILGSGITGPVIDWTGVNRKQMIGVEIYGDAGSPPDIGILLTRNNQGNSQSAGLTVLERVDIEGTFDVAAVYNYGSEELAVTDSVWAVTVPVIYIGTRENTKYAVTLPNSSATGSLSNTIFTFNNVTFNNKAASGTAVAVIELMGVTSFSIDNSFLNDTADDIPLIWIHEETLNNSKISITNTTFHQTYTMGVLLEDDPTFLSIKNNSWGVTATTAEIVGGSATGTVTLVDSELEAPNIDFSDATADIDGDSIIRATTSLNVARRLEGRVTAPNRAAVTLGTPTSAEARILYTDDGSIEHLGRTETTVQLTTTDGIANDMWTATLPDESLYSVLAFVSSRKTTALARNGYAKRVITYRDGGGAATIEGAVQDLHTDIETNAGADATFVVSGNDVKLQVTSDAAVNTRWIATITLQRLE